MNQFEDIACPKCRALPGERCARKTYGDPHLERIAKWNYENPPLDPDIERRYEDLMWNVDQRTRDAIESPSYHPTDEFSVERHRLFAELCRLGLRTWNVRV